MYTVYMSGVLTHIIFDMDASLNKRISSSSLSIYKVKEHNYTGKKAMKRKLQKIKKEKEKTNEKIQRTKKENINKKKTRRRRCTQLRWTSDNNIEKGTKEQKL